MGSKGSSTTSFTPPPEVVEAYKEALGYGRAAMGMQYQPYTGEITAPLTPTQESGIYNVNRAVGTAIPYFGQATELTANAAGRTIAPQQFSQEAIQQYQSPYTQAVADATFRNLREQQRQEQAGLQGQAIRAGAFGGDRAGIAAANMARQQDLATALAMSQIYNQGYQQATGLFGQQQGVNLAAQQADAARQMQGAQQLAGLGTGLQGSVLQGAQAQLAAGAQQQAVQQAINSGYYNQYLAAQAYPYQQAQFFANLATGVGGQMGGTTTGTPAQPSPVGSIFGALGAIGSIMSDKRAKENIKPIGKTNDGQTIYRFNYKGDDVTQIGLLAQEVEKKHPEAVTTINGLKGVDYKEATDDAVRSMGGGVVPSSVRKDFAAGGPSISDEEDPMIPYKAGVPSKVLQIPKLARIGGNKPNFGGELPKQPGTGGMEPSQMKGAAEGLGKAFSKISSFGKDIGEGTSELWALGGAVAARRRRRFAYGDEVPVTSDSVYIPDRDQADIIKPSFNPDTDAAPIRLASLGDAARRIDSGAPSAEPVREPAREIPAGLVPSMARDNADLPPLFSGKETPEPSRMAIAAKQAADAEPEAEPAAKPVSVPSMARADANVPAVKPGLEPARAPVQQQAASLTPTDRDAVIRTIIGESGREPYEGQLGVAQVIRNRQLSGRYGKSASDVVYAPKQFSVWNAGDPAGVMANKVDPNSPLYQRIGKMVDQVWAGEAEDPTKGATHFANVATVMAQRGNLQPWLQGMIDSGKTIKIGAHTFGQADAGAYGPSGERPQERVRVAEAGLGAGKTATDAGDRKWNFGMAGEGKRSIIESLMDRDFDPIQKRALFSFFAGMAASPSPWFGQQLGAGMQAASNVYNEAMNRQNELEIRRQQLGMEQQRIGISKEQVDVAKQNAARQLLSSMTDTIRKYKMAGVPLPAYIQDLFKQAGVPLPVTGGLGAPSGLQQPEGGLVPAPSAVEPKAPSAPEAPEAPKPPAPQGGVVPAPEKPAAQPEKRAEADAGLPIQQASVQTVFAPEGTTDQEKRSVWARMPNSKNPEYWEAQKKIDPEGFDYYEGRRKAAEEALQKDQGFRDKDGNFIRLPAYEQKLEQERKEGIKTKKQDIRLEENSKHFETVAQQRRSRQELDSRLRNIEQILTVYETGAFAEEKGRIQAALRSIGFDPQTVETATANQKEFEKFTKNQIANSFSEIQGLGLGQRFTNMELQAAQNAQAGPGMQPEANRAIIGYTRGLTNWMNKRDADAIREAERIGYENFNRTKFEMEWAEKPENNMDKFIDDAKKNVAVRGGTPRDPRDLVPGQAYMLEPGQHRSQKLQRVRFIGLETNKSGQTVPKFKPEPLQ